MRLPRRRGLSFIAKGLGCASLLPLFAGLLLILGVRRRVQGAAGRRGPALHCQSRPLRLALYTCPRTKPHIHLPHIPADTPRPAPVRPSPPSTWEPTTADCSSPVRRSAASASSTPSLALCAWARGWRRPAGSATRRWTDRSTRCASWRPSSAVIRGCAPAASRPRPAAGRRIRMSSSTGCATRSDWRWKSFRRRRRRDWRSPDVHRCWSPTGHMPWSSTSAAAARR